jgi:glycerol-3-phosphate dehydrogenase
MENRRTVDLLVIGGGINGTGIARDAAGRGLSVLLCEQGDLAGATSSASSKLIHGGLRYLEQRAFRFVRRALIEREVLLSVAPHLVRPMRFVLPVDKTLRPPWLIATGLFLYDRLARRRRLPRSRRLDLRRCTEGAPLDGRFTTGFAYSDCVVDDSRLVVVNALDARERGAEIYPRTRCLSLERGPDLWRAGFVDLRDGTEQEVAARVVVNAAGPWVAQIQAMAGSAARSEPLRLVKGSHILVPRLYAGEHAYILQNDDRRVVFVIPYEQNFSLVGTTEVDFEGDPALAKITEEEVAYLCRAVSRAFVNEVVPGMVEHSYSGVRPLYDDSAENASSVSREYVLGLDAPEQQAPLLTVYGGKITTYRRLAEEAIDQLAPFLDLKGEAWTGRVALPGGDIADADLACFIRELRAEFPWLPRAMVDRLAHAYGTRVRKLLGTARSLADLGTDLGGGLTPAEIDYLVAEEWAQTGEDVLWRRSKLGLHMTEEARACVAGYVRGRVASQRGGDLCE